jgi:hypothetical protein
VSSSLEATDFGSGRSSPSSPIRRFPLTHFLPSCPISPASSPRTSYLLQVSCTAPVVLASTCPRRDASRAPCEVSLFRPARPAYARADMCHKSAIPLRPILSIQSPKTRATRPLLLRWARRMTAGTRRESTRCLPLDACPWRVPGFRAYSLRGGQC